MTLEQPPMILQTSAASRRRFQREVRTLASSAGVFWIERLTLIEEMRFFADARNSKIAFVGALNMEDLQRLRPALHQFGRVRELDGVHLSALWFEKGCEQGLFLAPGKHLCSLDQRTCNAGMETRVLRELKTFGEREAIVTLAECDVPTCLAMRCAFIGYLEDAMEKTFGIPSYTFPFLWYHNSQKEIERCYKDYCRDIYPTDGSNAEWFGRHYYWNIRVMRDIFGDSGKGITVHDVGTNVGHLPLMLARLNQEELMGLNISRIIASDLHPDVPRQAIRQVLEKEHIPTSRVEVIRLDLLKKMHKMPDADVITANDVLEHFPEETSLALLKGLWSRTKKLLMIHVPIEEVSSKEYGHCFCFTGEKIRQWASLLPGGVFLSDRYSEHWGPRLSDQGYLFMMKES